MNSYAILVAFVGLLRLALGLLVVGLGALAWRAARRPAADRDALSDRFYLLFLMALLLLGLNLASWPLLYLLLQSYVSDFPGVMCIYGVTRIGVGSTGPARHLPDLVGLLQVTKPALVFVGGAWFVLYLVNRRSATGPLLPRLLVGLLPLGALAVADAAAELTYIAIPKTEDVPTAGCCTATDDADRYTPTGVTGASAREGLSAAFHGGTGLLILALGAATVRPSVGRGALALLSTGAVAVTALGGVFLIDVVAPKLLGLPYHHCPYDLVGRAPEAVVTVTLFLAGGYSLGWAQVVNQFGRGPETDPFLPGVVRGLLRFGLWCYVASILMLSLELTLA